MRLRIGLKWFLLACTALALAMAFLGKPCFDRWRQQQVLDRQQSASERLAAAGAEVKMADGRIVEVHSRLPQSDRAALDALKDAVDIEKLDAFWGTDDELIGLLDRHHELRELLVGGKGITNRSLHTIGKMRRLKKLSLIGAAIDDDGLMHLRNLQQLRELDLSSTQVLGTGLKHLSQLRGLERLNLSGTLVDDSHLNAVGSLPSLMWLNLSETRVRGPGLAHLAGIRRLESLELGKMTLTDGSGLGELDRVHTLTMFHVTIPPAELAHVAGMEGLTTINLHGPMFTDKHLESLAVADQLRRLEIWGGLPCTISEGGLAQLKSADQLRYLTLFGVLQDEPAQRLSKELPKVKITLGDGQPWRVYGPESP